VLELEALLSEVHFRQSVPREMPKPKPRSRASIGCDTIPNTATTAANNIILRIAALPDRASGAAHGVRHPDAAPA
jgi:hypothetical protein